MRQYSGVLLVTCDNSLLLQQRDSKPGIKNPGMITTFGGAVEENESLLECAVRELKEETNLEFSPSDLKFFTSLIKIEDDGSNTELNIFSINGVDASNLKVYEGKGFYEVRENDDFDTINFSVSARKIVKLYFQKKV